MRILRNWVLILVIIGIVPSISLASVTDQDMVEFSELVLDEPATSFAMTEDGRELVITHQAGHFVSIYDVLSHKVTVTVPCISPRSVICRGDEAYVVNFGESTISILSRAKGWKKINDVKLPKSYIDHIAAAQGERFNREIIASCRTTKGSDNIMVAVNLDRDTTKELGSTTIAEVSFDGRLIMFQTLLNNDGFGGLAAFNTKDLTNPRGSREPVFRGGTGQTPYVYQTFSGSFWLS